MIFLLLASTLLRFGELVYERQASLAAPLARPGYRGYTSAAAATTTALLADWLERRTSEAIAPRVDVTVLLLSNVSAEVAALLRADLASATRATLRSLDIVFRVERLAALSGASRLSDAVHSLPSAARDVTDDLQLLVDELDATSSDERARPLARSFTVIVFESGRAAGFRSAFSSAELDAALGLPAVADAVRAERDARSERFLVRAALRRNARQEWHDAAASARARRAVAHAAARATPLRVALNPAEAAARWASQRLAAQPLLSTVAGVLARAPQGYGSPERAALLAQLLLHRIGGDAPATAAGAVDRWVGRKRLAWIDLSAAPRSAPHAARGVRVFESAAAAAGGGSSGSGASSAAAEEVGAAPSTPGVVQARITSAVLSALMPAAGGAAEDGAHEQVSFFIYRYILRESCSQFDSLPLTY